MDHVICYRLVMTSHLASLMTMLMKRLIGMQRKAKRPSKKPLLKGQGNHGEEVKRTR